MLKQKVIITRLNQQFAQFEASELKKWEVKIGSRKFEGKCGVPEEVPVIALNILRDIKEPIRQTMKAGDNDLPTGTILDYKNHYIIQELGVPFDSENTNVKTITYKDMNRSELFKELKKKGIKYDSRATNETLRTILEENE